MPENKTPIVVACYGGDDNLTATFGEITLVELELGSLENFDDWLDVCVAQRVTLRDLRENYGHPGYEAAEYIEEQLKRAMP